MPPQRACLRGLPAQATAALRPVVLSSELLEPSGRATGITRPRSIRCPAIVESIGNPDANAFIVVPDVVCSSYLGHGSALDLPMQSCSSRGSVATP